MSGSANEAGKVLGVSTVVGGGATELANTGFNGLAVILISVAVIGVALVISSSTIKRFMVR